MTADSRDEASASRPCLIVAHGDPHFAGALGWSFRRLGWDVYQARSGPEARRLARMLDPDLMVLATELEEESGWLTCEKLTGELPRIKVFLIGDAGEQRSHDFAAFTGAAGLLDGKASVATLVQEVCGRVLHAAG